MGCWAVPDGAFFDLEELAAVARTLKQGRGVGGVCEIREIPVQFLFILQFFCFLVFLVLFHTWPMSYFCFDLFFKNFLPKACWF